jgi:hypothetical protein
VAAARTRSSTAPGRRRPRWPWALAALVLAAAGAIAFILAVVNWSDARLREDASALADVDVEAFAGTIESARVIEPGGRAVSLVVDHGRLTPRQKIVSGRVVSVEVVIRRPGWARWLIGATRTEHLEVRTPLASIPSQWLTVKQGAPLQVGFSQSVATVAYAAGSAPRRVVQGQRSAISVETPVPAGSVRVALAARPWERLGPAVTVRWFPEADRPVALVEPAPGAVVSPTDPLRLTFSVPVTAALGTVRPTLVPTTPGRWRTIDAHTIVFTPSGFGLPFDAEARLRLPRSVAVTGPAGRRPSTTREIAWRVRPASTLRLQQLLADAGYLPLKWVPEGGDVALTRAAEATAAVSPPKGRFLWRYPNTPHELTRLWSVGTENTIIRGAVMMFQDEHHLAVDGIAGRAVWRMLLADAIARRRRELGYSYVYVHRDEPQLLTLWHNGYVVLTSPGNTGVPAAPTELGTFPVFEHLPSTTMSGTNPDGTHYNDPGVKWVSYFNGGDALHAFNRASFGTPQSLGCVELPLASAARVWPYTPIGALVTIES